MTNREYGKKVKTAFMEMKCRIIVDHPMWDVVPVVDESCECTFKGSSGAGGAGRAIIAAAGVLVAICVMNNI